MIPYFRFFPERYWMDAFDLTDAEHGIYLQLLIHQWNTPKCRLPNDDEWLARKMRRSVVDVKAEVRPIIERFFSSTGNYVYQSKLFEEFTLAHSLRQRGSAGGKALVRKKKDASQNDALAQIDEVPTSTSTSTSTKKEDISLDSDFDDWYSGYPRKVGKGQARKAYTGARKKVDAETLIAGRKRYDDEIRAKGTEKKYIRHPSTWLNGEGWKDEPDVDPPPKGSRIYGID